MGKCDSLHELSPRRQRELMSGISVVLKRPVATFHRLAASAMWSGPGHEQQQGSVLSCLQDAVASDDEGSLEDGRAEHLLHWGDAEWDEARARRQRILADALLAAAAADACSPLMMASELKVQHLVTLPEDPGWQSAGCCACRNLCVSGQHPFHAKALLPFCAQALCVCDQGQCNFSAAAQRSVRHSTWRLPCA